MLKSPQTFDITCRIEAWDDDHLAICHCLERNGKIHAELRALMQFHDAGRNPVPTADVMRALGNDKASTQMPATFQNLINAAQNIEP